MPRIKVLSGRRMTTVVVFVFTVVTAVRAVAREPVVLNDDGAWCWFQDERAILHGSVLLVGSVANGARDASRRGDVDLTEYDTITGRVRRWELHDQLESDDHAAPALWMRPDGRLLAVYSKHGTENKFYSRTTRSAGDFGDWLPEASFVPSEPSRVTYSNLHFSAGEGESGRLYNFFRGLDGSFKPSFAFSDDSGRSWQTGGIVIDVPLAFRHRPYVKYCSDGRGTIHFVYTEGHPRDFDNSLYHIYLRRGQLHRSDGAVIAPLSRGLTSPAEGTRIFSGDPQNVAWPSDLHLSADGRPYLVYSVQKNSEGLKSADPQAGQDHRYRYSWWDGTQWQDHEIGYGGSRLYPGEDDYTGNISLDPADLTSVYLSTNSDPITGKPLMSRAAGRRHYEIYRACTSNGGLTWAFEPITRDSTCDNLRPIVPVSVSAVRTRYSALVWFRGTYCTYRSYDTEIVTLALPLIAP